MRLDIEKFAPRSENHMRLLSVGEWLLEIRSTRAKSIQTISDLYISLKCLISSEIANILIFHPERLGKVSRTTIGAL
jgi:hypothetical protein